MRKLFQIACVVALPFSGLAQKIWTGSVDSLWNNAANWSPAGVPGSTDVVELRPIGTGLSWPVVTGTSNCRDLIVAPWSNSSSIRIAATGSLTINRQLSILDNGQVVVAGTLSHTGGPNRFTMGYTNALLEVHGGSFTTASNAQINGQLTATSGTLNFQSNFTLSSGKTMNLGAAAATFSGTATINGTFGGGSGSAIFNGTFACNSGGVFNAGSATVSLNSTININSNGTYNGQDGTSTFAQSVTVQGSGVVTVNNGSLNFQGDADFRNSAVLTVTGTGSVSINGSTEFKNSGSLNLGNGSITINGDATFQQTGSLSIDGGSFTVTGDATLQQSGTMSVNSGTLSIQGTANLSNGGSITSTTGTINLEGDLNMTGTSALDAGSSTINFSGGNLNTNGNFDAGTSTVNLTGTGSQTISGDVTFYNLNVETEGTVTSTGSITVVNDAVIDSTATVSVAPGEDLNVQGDLVDNSPTPIAVSKPFVKTVQATALNLIQVEFNEAVTSASAQTLGNYALSGGFTVTGAALQSNPALVQLTLSGNLTNGTEYTLTLNNIVSQSSGGVISANHIKRFTPAVIAPPPSTGPSNLVTTRSLTSLALNWTPAVGANTLIVIKANTALTASPQTATTYAANANYTLGGNLGGGKVVYAGSGNSVTITGLEQNRVYYLRAYSYSASGSPSYNTTQVVNKVLSTGMELQLAAMLEGPYDSITGLMSTALRTANLLPTTQPFTAEPFNYSGDESQPNLPADMVDWVLVELRMGTSPENATSDKIMDRKAGLLLSNGTVLDPVTLGPLTMYPDTAGQLYVVVRTLTHLPVMADVSLTRLSNGKMAFDFTANAIYNPEAVKTAGSETVIKAGRADGGNANSETDRLALWNLRNSTGYSAYDLNLDGYLNAEDRSIMWNNREIATALP